MEGRYIPSPIDTSDVEVSPQIARLAERLAENTHEVWALGRVNDGWVYGPVLDREKKDASAARTLFATSGERKRL